MVDRVELVARHEPRQVRELDRDHARWCQHPLHAGDEVVQVGNVCHHVVGDQQIGPPALRRRDGRELPTEERDERLDSSLPRRPATFAAGSTPSAGMPRSTTCWSR